MNNLKKIVSVLICMLMSVGVVGCSEKTNVTPTSDGQSSQTSVSTESTVSYDELIKEYEDKGYTVATEDDMTFEFDYSDDVYALKRVSKDVDVVIIPEEHEGYKVTSIRSWAFGAKDDIYGEPTEEPSNVIEVVISDNITDIHQEAFQHCTTLKRVVFGKNVETVGESLFMNCTSLEEVVLSDSLKSLSQWMFGGCTSLKTITIPDSISSIHDATFSRCSSLEEIHIPNSVSGISNHAFDDSDNLTIYAPAGSYAEGYATDNNIPFTPES